MKITRRLDPNWDITFGQGISNYCRNQEACAQNVRSRLLLLLGEWFLDTSAGTFNTDMMGQKPLNLPLLEARAKATIIGTEDVQNLLSFSMAFDKQTRKLSITASLNTIYGTTENIEVRSL